MPDNGRLVPYLLVAFIALRSAHSLLSLQVFLGNPTYYYSFSYHQKVPNHKAVPAAQTHP